jgi:KinB signaling pathway activation protein
VFLFVITKVDFSLCHWYNQEKGIIYIWGNVMNSRNIVRLFISTLIIGGISGGGFGFIIRWREFSPLFTSFEMMEIVSVFVWLIGVGLIFSVISQAGFFAYLTVHRFGLGMFKSVFLWNAVQVVLIAFVVFDLIWLRYINFSNNNDDILSYIAPAILLLGLGTIVAYFKMKQTNKQAFIPALFFMTVITILEWMPILRTNDESWLYFMLFPLLICNAYQLLIINKLIDRSKKELSKKNSKKPSHIQSGKNVDASGI